MAELAEYTQDAFLGGRVRVFQPAQGYRAGADAVFLAAAVPAKAGETVLELGLGVGVASLCLAARVPRLQLTGVERHSPTAALARRNAVANSVVLDVVEADIATLPAEIRNRTYARVLMNPPYFQTGTKAPDSARATARHELTPLADWIEIGMRRLAHGGTLSLVQEAARLPEILTALDARVGGISVRPLASRTNRPPRRIIVTARKGARAPFCLLPPFVVHEGALHDADRDSYSAAAQAVLRDGAALR